MNKAQAERYARHIQLDEIGFSGQEDLLASRVLVIGAGGLGSPALMYLASAGVGQLVVSDFDRVELSNLQRQIIHHEADIGREKALSAAERIRALNPSVNVRAIPWALDETELRREVDGADVVLDASDNFETRFELNRTCVQTRTPLVSAAAVRMEGQVLVIDPRQPDSPCYRCLYDDAGEPDEPCSLVGVFAPLLGLIGSLQAMQALKLLIGFNDTGVGRLTLFDAQRNEWRTVRLLKDPCCPVCTSRDNV